MAYVDGALDVQTAQSVEAAASEDEAVAAQVEALRRTRELSRAALGSLLDEPVPDALTARVRAFAARHPAAAPETSDARPAGGSGDGGTVVAFGPRQRSPLWQRSGFGMGLAASIALIVGLGTGFFAAGGLGTFGKHVETVTFDQADLVDAIDSVPSGGERQLSRGDSFRAIATFALEDGTLCREFEVAGSSTVIAVACRQDGAWQTRFTVASQASGQDYTPAASLDVLQAYLTAVGAQAPLDAAAEAAALDELR